MKRLIFFTIIGLVLAFSAYAAPAWDVDTGGTLSTGLRAWYNFENVNDETATYNLTNFGSTPFAAGKINNAANLNGSSQYFQAANGMIDWGNPAFSASCWFKTNGSDTNFAIFSSHGGDGGEDGWTLDYGNQNAGNWTFNKPNISGKIQYTTSTPDSNWHNIVVVGRSSGTGQELYIDGVSRVSGGSTNAPASSNDPITIGRYTYNGGDNGGYITGLMDLCGFWNKSLSTQEIADLYNSGTGDAYREPSASAPAPILRRVNGLKARR